MAQARSRGCFQILGGVLSPHALDLEAGDEPVDPEGVRAPGEAVGVVGLPLPLLAVAPSPGEVVVVGLPVLEAPGVDSELQEAQPVEAALVEAPEVEGPEVEGPDVEGPEVEAPEVGGPEVEGPDVEGPEVGAPMVGAQDLAEPEVAAQS